MVRFSPLPTLRFPQGRSMRVEWLERWKGWPFVAVPSPSGALTCKGCVEEASCEKMHQEAARDEER
jgi:hypothetical protein